MSITDFDSHAPIGRAEALYLEGVAGPVPDAERTPSLPVLNARLPQHQQLTTDDLVEPGALLVYAAQLTRHFVLVRGGDPGFDNVTDMRLQVTPHPGFYASGPAASHFRRQPKVRATDC